MDINYVYTRILRIILYSYIIITLWMGASHVFFKSGNMPRARHSSVSAESESGSAIDGMDVSLESHIDLKRRSNSDNVDTTRAAHHIGGIDLEANFLYSKLFQHAMKPSRVVPFHYRASVNPAARSLTVTTIIDESRLDRLLTLVREFRGPISVAIHIHAKNNHKQVMRKLASMYAAEPLMREHVDAHLVVDNFDRQFNYWRNVARLFARTNYILMLDVDFVLCSNLAKRLSANNAKTGRSMLMRMLDDRVAFVIPAFEHPRSAGVVDVREFPRTKSALLNLAQKGQIVEFHKFWVNGHGPTNYTRWFNSTEPYPVEDDLYNFSYEPYVVFHKDYAPWCDERFVGYGANKAACLYELYLAGFKFYVLPDDFLIHQRHDYPEQERRVERRYNRRLYDHFREETCVKYNRMVHVGSMSGIGVGSTDTIPDKRNCRRFIRGFMNK